MESHKLTSAIVSLLWKQLWACILIPQHLWTNFDTDSKANLKHDRTEQHESFKYFITIKEYHQADGISHSLVDYTTFRHIPLFNESSSLTRITSAVRLAFGLSRTGQDFPPVVVGGTSAVDESCSPHRRVPSRVRQVPCRDWGGLRTKRDPPDSESRYPQCHLQERTVAINRRQYHTHCSNGVE